MSIEHVDVVIIGGGPTGLSAALTLGRGNKRVVVVDGGVPRNHHASHVNGLFGRDHTPPAELRAVGREQLAPYGGVVVEGCVTDIDNGNDGFVIEVTVGAERAPRFIARRVLLAAGVVDGLPPMPNLERLWGRGVFTCPYCHAWELRGRPLGVVVDDVAHFQLARFMKGWSDDVTAFVGIPLPDDEERAALQAANVTIAAKAVAFEGAETLEAVVVEGGARVPCNGLVMRPPQRPARLIARLQERLGLKLAGPYVVVDDTWRTSIAGVFAAGDLTNTGQSAVVGAAEGTRAAYAINLELTLDTSRAMTPRGAHC